MKSFYTAEEIKSLTEVLELNTKFGRKCIAGETVNELYKMFNERHTHQSIMGMLSKIRTQKAKNVEEPKQEIINNESLATSEPVNGIGKLCRLSKEIESLAVAFNKAVKEFREEYDDNIELLRKTAKLRQAAEDVSRKIVKGE